MANETETDALQNVMGEEERVSIRLNKDLLGCLDKWAADKERKGKKSGRSDQLRICIVMRRINEIREKGG